MSKMSGTHLSRSASASGAEAKPVERLQELLPELFSSEAQDGELLLRFQLTECINAAFSLEKVVEALRVPAEQVTPIPNMPEATLGLMAMKGKVFWAVDLAQLLACPKVGPRSRFYEMIVIRIPAISDAGEELFLGLSVHRIRGTYRLIPGALASPGSVPGSVVAEASLLMPYLRGQVQDPQETWQVLSLETILSLQGLITG